MRHSGRSSSHHPSIQEGFTLVELVVVLVIVGMAVVFGLPNLRREQIKARDNVVLRETYGVLELSRSEALKRHSPVAVVFDVVGESMVAFEDWDRSDPDAATNGDGLLNSSKEEMLGRLELEPAMHFGHPDGESPVQLGSDPSLAYVADGSLRQSPGLAAEPAVYLADSRGNYFRLRLNRFSGSARVEKLVEGTGWTPRREQWIWNH